MKLRKKSTSRRRKRSTLGRMEHLEPRVVLDGRLLITEFVASNDDGIVDEDGDSSDWLEILNAGDETVNLDGWYLTDEANDLNKWEAPDVDIPPGQYLLVFASAKDRDDPNANLHTNFRLSSDGEYLALTRPDRTIEFEYSPEFPQQVEDVAYGVPSAIVRTEFVSPGSAARVHVPTDGTLDPDLANEVIENSWIDPALDTAGPDWIDVTTGVGYWDESTDPNPKPGDGVVIADSATEFSNSQNRDNWRYGYWNETNDADGVYDPNSGDFRQLLWIGLNTIGQFNHWDGTKWDLKAAPETPHTEIRDDGMMPAGSNSGPEVHQAVRRWTSEITGGVLIHGTIDNPDPAGDGSVARILLDGEEVYRAEVNGSSDDYSVILQVTTDQRIDFMVGSGPQNNDVGDDTIFTATIEDVTAIIGEQSGVPTLAADIATDLEDQLKGVSSSAYIRIPFVPETAAFDALTLEMKYQDAFIAYLNGQVIASSNGPDPVDASWDSTATSERSIADAVEFQSFGISGAIDLLNIGSENVLAIHAMNVSADDDDFLASSSLVGTKLEIVEDGLRYFPTPTPATQNGLGVEAVGPLFTGGTHSPVEPDALQPIVVTANVAETFDAVTNVRLNYRVMYGTTRRINMLDDGSGADTMAGDGIYTATIPSGIAQAGDMVRWFMTASDASGNESRFPTFEDPQDSEEYLGTVYRDSTLLPENPDLVTFQTYFQNPSAMDTTSGTFGSVYYDGEFYDNVKFDRHGQSSGGFPKKSFDVNFPEDHRFRLRDDIPRYKKFNLLSNYADKAKMRNAVAWETRRLTGTPSALSFPVLMHRNGEFFSLTDFVEDADDRFLQRVGLDTNNPVYKIYNTFNTASGAEKKTARDVPGNTDLTEFINGLNSNSGQSLTNFIYDNVDLASMANYLAGFTVTSNRDCCHKNFYAYRDASGSGEWSFFPWDVDLSYGRNWGGFGLAYHDYTIYPNNDIFVGRNNNLISKLYNIDDFEEMYLRRMRTLMDEIYGAPDAGNTTIEDYVQGLVDQIGSYGQQDLDKWGQVSSGHQAQPFETWDVAVDKLLNEYLQPRREFLYETLTTPDPNMNVEDPVLVFRGSDVSSRYFVPGDNSINEVWIDRGFDDSIWDAGQFGYGYENSPADYQNEIDTRVKPTDVVPNATTLMTRTLFDLDDIGNFEKMTLNVKYDDAFVAYINGTEVVKIGVAGDVLWNSTGTNHSDSAAVQFAPFVFDADDVTLFETDNVLAIQLVNQAVGSSDMLLNVDLYTGVIQATTSTAPIPAGQNADATVDIVAVDFNPTGGNQDQEYIQLTNNGQDAVDITGWQLNGAVEMTFRPGTVIAAGSSLYVTPDAQAFRARTDGPSGGQGLFVQEGYNGHLSNFGETIDLIRTDGSLATSFTYEGNPTPVQEHLRITEIMYHPLGPSSSESTLSDKLVADDFEWVELMNTGPATLDLTDVRFTGGITFDFTGSNAASLAPGGRTLVVGDLIAFQTRYPGVAAAQVAGVFTDGSLSNDGETIKLEDATNSTVQEFAYNDNGDDGWSERADGRGSSLQIIDTTEDYGDPANWRPSSEISGSPGIAGVEALSGLVINEVLTNSEPPAVDAIELVNTSGDDISLENHYLSDSAMNRDTLQDFELPATTLAPGEHVVFTEADFNASGGVDPRDFALSSFGDQVYLTVGDVGQATHFVDFVQFGATAAGESYGRFPDGSGPLVPMTANTFGGSNSSPRIGPAIISELQYNPGEPTAEDLAIDPTIEENDLEFVEIHNTSGSQLILTNWRLRGGVDIDFDEASTLDAGETIVVVSFNPENPGNSNRVTAFRSHYGIDEDVRLVGGYGGRLDDGGERVTLQRPGTPPDEDPTNIPRLLEDEVRYSDSAPWTPDADGTGLSLTRVLTTGLGSDSTSWTAADPTPGAVDFSNIPGDTNQDGVVDSADIDAIFNAINTGDNRDVFDVNNSGAVNADDVTHLVESIIGTFMGDTNLDGVVDATDLNQVGIHWRQESGATWLTGDFTGNGAVTSADLNIIGINWRQGAGPIAAARTPRAALAAGARPGISVDLADDESDVFQRQSAGHHPARVVSQEAAQDLILRRRAIRSMFARRNAVLESSPQHESDFASLADDVLADWKAL